MSRKFAAVFTFMNQGNSTQALQCASLFVSVPLEADGVGVSRQDLVLLMQVEANSWGSAAVPDCKCDQPVQVNPERRLP